MMKHKKRYSIKSHSSGASIAGSKGILKGVHSYDLIKERRKLRKREHS